MGKTCGGKGKAGRKEKTKSTRNKRRESIESLAVVDWLAGRLSERPGGLCSFSNLSNLIFHLAVALFFRCLRLRSRRFACEIQFFLHFIYTCCLQGEDYWYFLFFLTCPLSHTHKRTQTHSHTHARACTQKSIWCIYSHIDAWENERHELPPVLPSRRQSTNRKSGTTYIDTIIYTTQIQRGKSILGYRWS